MDANQQPTPNQSSQQMNAGMPQQMQQNMMMQPNQGMPMGGQGRPAPPGGFQQQQQQFQGGAPNQFSQGQSSQQQQFAMMQQQMAQGQGMFNQGGRGGPQAQGQNQQYRAKQQMGGGHQNMQPGGFQGGMGGGQQHNMGRGPNPNMMMGMPGFGMQGVPGGLIEGIGTKVSGLMNGGAGFQGQPGAQGAKRTFDPSHALYIGNLSDAKFDLDLFKHFQARAYKLKSARVMFDDQSRSKRFGYLNFHDAVEAERCLAEMNNCTISGKQIVLNKQKDRDFDSNANLLVRNLPKSVDQRQLAEMFQKFGRIVSCKLEIYGDGSSRGFGYVQFDSVDNATKAINELDNTIVDGQNISVLTHQKQEKREGTATERYTNLFLQNLPEDFTSEQLRDIFAKYGEIASLEMGAKPGHGYVSFKDHADAKKALDAVNMKLKLGDMTVLVSPHIYKKESDLQPKSGVSNPIVQNQKEMFKSNIYVRFIPCDVTKEELEAEFSKAGTICSTKLKPYEITNKMDGTKFVSHQIAYVLYDEVKSAQKCIRMFDNSRPFGLNHKALKVDFWQAKEDLKKEKDEKSQNQIKQLINFIKQVNHTQRGQYMGQHGYGGGMPQPTPGMMQGQNVGGAGGFQGQDGGQMQQQQQQQHAGQSPYGQGQRQGYGGGQHRGGYHNNQRGGGRGQGRGGRGGYHQNNRGGHKNQGHHGGRGGYHQQQQQPGGHNQMGQMQQQQPNMGQQMQNPHEQLTLPAIDSKPLDFLKGEERENFVGNHIYGPILSAFGSEEAPTVTGMILDESAVDYKELLTNQQYFASKVQEARAILKKSQESAAAQAQQQ